MNRTRVIIAIVLTYMVFAVLMNSVGTVILQAIQSFHIDKTQASTLEAFKDLPVAIVSFALASFLPRLGYRRAMMMGLAIVALACSLMALLPSFWMTRLLFVSIGAGFAVVKVSVYTLIGLLTSDEKQHASLTNSIEGLFMIGVLGGYWLFGAFIDPGQPQSLSWLNVYWVLAAACLLVVAMLAGSKFDESAARTPAIRLRDDFLGMLRLAARPLVLLFVLSAMLYVLIEQSIGTWLPTFNNEVLRLPTAMSVQMASLFAGSLALGRLLAGVLLRRLRWHHLLYGCLAAMATLVLVTLPLAQGIVPGSVTGWSSVPLAAFVFPLIGLFMAPIYPAIVSVVLSALPRPQHAAMTGLIVVASALGGTTGSMITGLVFGSFGGQTAFYLSLLPMAAIALTLWAFQRAAHAAAGARAVSG
ncbi:MAG: MFS transporter [Xanthomonadaceae bacterium]|nr:MFS transporter [Xanthomonadaceae bacterium]MDP2184512.1 MFS transporter [Xanthomonadales bacterium]MDZ4115368.1 MFS transporter [Xanthomonadaceae bacterium]MDZ4378515.1 MFS transporter [Xanthomonadaceae bacterium]